MKPMPRTPLAWTMVVCAAIAALALGHSAWSAEELPPCGSTPVPPLLVVLPDGTEIPAARVVYALEARRLDVIGYTRLFCDGYEGAP